jgi:hypothetical protein
MKLASVKPKAAASRGPTAESTSKKKTNKNEKNEPAQRNAADFTRLVRFSLAMLMVRNIWNKEDVAMRSANTPTSK